MANKKVALAEALLRRKELQGQVERLKTIKESDVYAIINDRISVNDGMDNIVAKIPKLTAAQVMREYNWHARQLRLVDAAIQQANWTTELDLEAEVMGDYEGEDPEEEAETE